jgi:hypothetical protein
MCERLMIIILHWRTKPIGYYDYGVSTISLGFTEGVAVLTFTPPPSNWMSVAACPI